MNEGKRGRGDGISIYYLPRVVITQIHPTINTLSLCTPNSKRKLEGPGATAMELLSKSQKVVNGIIDTTENRGESSHICLEHLPSLVLCHIMQFLPHSALINLSMTSSQLHSLVMREWKSNPSLWRHITLSPTLSPHRLASLKKALMGKKKFIRSIRFNIVINTALSLKSHSGTRIADGIDFLSDSVCDFICGFYRLRRIVVQPKIKHRHIIRFA